MRRFLCSKISASNLLGLTSSNSNSAFVDLTSETADEAQEDDWKSSNSDTFQRRPSVTRSCIPARFRNSFSARNIILKLLPTQLSQDDQDDHILTDSAMVRLNVYRIDDHLGLYHTGIVFCHTEYTFCQNKGICCHQPRMVDFATYIGTIRLGSSKLSKNAFQNILEKMKDVGFSHENYDVMQNSCNTFTEELARRLNLLERYPSGVLNQTKIGEILSPLARALDLVPNQLAKDDNKSCCVPDLISWRHVTSSGNIFKASAGNGKDTRQSL